MKGLSAMFVVLESKDGNEVWIAIRQVVALKQDGKGTLIFLSGQERPIAVTASIDSVGWDLEVKANAQNGNHA